MDTGSFLMTQWMPPHLCTYEQHQLDSGANKKYRHISSEGTGGTMYDQYIAYMFGILKEQNILKDTFR